MNLKSLLEPAEPWLHLLAVEDCWDALRALERSKPGVVVRFIRGSKATTLAEFYDEIAAALQFPPYFGANADALLDCLRDLDWLPASAYVLVVLDADELLHKSAMSDRKKLAGVLAQAVRDWAAPAKGRKAAPMRVVFQASAEHAREVVERWHAAGLGLTPMEAD